MGGGGKGRKRQKKKMRRLEKDGGKERGSPATSLTGGNVEVVLIWSRLAYAAAT